VNGWGKERGEYNVPGTGRSSYKSLEIMKNFHKYIFGQIVTFTETIFITKEDRVEFQTL
jgi:hypothetical protein